MIRVDSEDLARLISEAKEAREEASDARSACERALHEANQTINSLRAAIQAAEWSPSFEGMCNILRHFFQEAPIFANSFGEKVDTIRKVRMMTGFGLNEAKDLCDGAWELMGLLPPTFFPENTAPPTFRLENAAPVDG